jgi:hypothetical protein
MTMSNNSTGLRDAKGVVRPRTGNMFPFTQPHASAAAIDAFIRGRVTKAVRAR